MERRSRLVGLWRRPGKSVWPQGHREFESRLLRKTEHEGSKLGFWIIGETFLESSKILFGNFTISAILELFVANTALANI